MKFFQIIIIDVTHGIRIKTGGIGIHTWF
ncbi:CRISPR-associated DxTHG motif protein [Chryseobacterium sp. 3008163]|nr:CRISPR-associated DxTHG motif protein [Chryseobacterium sp. 3008163]